MPYLMRALLETAKRRRKMMNAADIWGEARAAIVLGDPSETTRTLMLVAQDGQRAVAGQKHSADHALLEVTDAVMSATISRLRVAPSPFTEEYASLADAYSALLTEIRNLHSYDRVEAARLLKELNG